MESSSTTVTSPVVVISGRPLPSDTVYVTTPSEPGCDSSVSPLTRSDENPMTSELSWAPETGLNTDVGDQQHPAARVRHGLEDVNGGVLFRPHEGGEGHGRQAFVCRCDHGDAGDAACLRDAVLHLEVNEVRARVLRRECETRHALRHGDNGFVAGSERRLGELQRPNGAGHVIPNVDCRGHSRNNRE